MKSTRSLIYQPEIWVIVLVLSLISGCSTQQISDTMRILTDEDRTLTSTEVESGLREALIKGVSTGAEEVSKVGGYLDNPKIRIPFPPEVSKVENTLRDLGMGAMVDQFVATLNRGAEEAAKEAKPIFVNAIRQMTIADAMAILKGEQDAATQYLKKNTSDQLAQKFNPVIQSALDETGATRYYSDIVSTYNSLPLVQPVNPNLDQYATQLAIDGLFVKIAEEEKSIRSNPAARTSEILRRVFGSTSN